MNPTDDVMSPALAQLSSLHKAFVAQDELNARLRADWREQGWPFLRAALVETIECMGHTNWAWWKGNTYDAPLTKRQTGQLWFELADIFHFLLSEQMQREAEASPQGEDTTGTCRMTVCLSIINYFIAAELDQKRMGDRALSVESRIEHMASALTVNAGTLPAPEMGEVFRVFAKLCVAADMGLDKLLIHYFAKQVLNQFRWDNGYQTGTYKKIWHVDYYAEPVEDNVVLAEGVVIYLDTQGSLRRVEDLRMYLYDFLTRRYTSTVEPA